jgi:hypothetical protein
MKRENWLPILLGLVIGLAIGLYYSWVINPVEYVETSPASLREDFKSDYLALIASAYAYSGDLARAEARIAIFQEPNPATTFSQLAQKRLAMGRPQSETRALALMAAALGERPTPLASVPAQTRIVSPSPTLYTSTPTRTPLPPPTRTPTPTPGAPFELLDQEKVCDPDLYAPLIQVVVIDAAGRPVPGVEVLVVWDTGQDHFFTGLKPELGMGYGDFAMTEGTIYTVQVVKSETPITGLMAEDCIGDDDELFPGSWLLTFQQPEFP